MAPWLFCVVRRGVDFIENAEGRRLEAENTNEQGERGESLFAAGKQEDVLEALARRLREDFNARFGGVLRLGEAQAGLAAAEQLTERFLEVDADLRVGFLELPIRDGVDFFDGLGGVHDGG